MPRAEIREVVNPGWAPRLSVDRNIKEASVKNLAISAGLILVFCLVAGPAVKADTTEIQDSLISISGPGGNILGNASELSPSGSGAGYSYSSSGFVCTSAPCPYGTGVSSDASGTYTIKLTASTSGTYNVTGYFDVELSIPFFNEYANVDGTAATGQSYEIENPNTSSIYNDALTNTLNNTNAIPMGTDNENGTGTNSDVAFAMNFSENLSAGETETVTFTISQSNPGGFNIEQVHPVDGENTTQTVAYFSGTESASSPCITNCGPPPPPTPEPNSLLLLATSLCGLLGLRKKLAN
jgi:hypothetical protein